eukprot:TRINITY_DN1479_c0_g2_i10.p1 TRINITY_DN1479_c0_g2~~TRINITY_DN1479_c0_g2_i10.p1  ORF type:complete len:565 (-),score=135.05 TRINITY_DN1479_c0_g2_i10:38-1732(-)
MASIFDRAKDLLQTVGSTVGLSPTIEKDQEIEKWKENVGKIENMADNLRKQFAAYSQAMIEMHRVAGVVGNSVATFYSSSAPRQKSVKRFSDAQTSLVQVSDQIFKEQFGWEILRVFDRWTQEAHDLKFRIKSLEESRVALLTHDARVKSLQQKIQRGNATRQDRVDLEQAESQLAGLQSNFNDSRTRIRDSVKHIIENRFTFFDQIFVRFMECQVDYYRFGSGLVDGFQVNIENYRRKYPRDNSSPAAESAAPSPSADSKEDDVPEQPSSPVAPVSRPARSKPTRKSVDYEDGSSAAMSPPSGPVAAPAPVPVVSSPVAAPAPAPAPAVSPVREDIKVSNGSHWVGVWDKPEPPSWKAEEKNAQHVLNYEYMKEKLGVHQQALHWLVPLCGDAPIVDYLVQQGHSVVGVEFVPKAVNILMRRFEENCGKVFERREVGAHVIFTSTDGKVTIVNGDFYTVPWQEVNNQFDMIYDRGSFVAILPAERPQYMDVIRPLLKPQGRVFIEAVDRTPMSDAEKVMGPPFHTTPEHIHTFFNFTKVLDQVGPIDWGRFIGHRFLLENNQA